jgi:hypothetical protein
VGRSYSDFFTGRSYREVLLGCSYRDADKHSSVTYMKSILRSYRDAVTRVQLQGCVTGSIYNYVLTDRIVHLTSIDVKCTTLSVSM